MIYKKQQTTSEAKEALQSRQIFHLPQHAEDLSGDSSDWIEDAKVDLPGQLALDIYETRNDLIVLCRVAGVDEKNIDVSISADNILNIRGTLMSTTNRDQY